MKGLLVFFGFVFYQSAMGAEVAFVLGMPDLDQPFVGQILHRSTNFVSDPELGITTEAFSIFYRKGVKSADSLGFVNNHGVGTYANLVLGLKEGAKNSKVVVTSVGPVSNDVCRELLTETQAAFVFTAGNSALEISGDDYPDCLAGHFLFITGLDPNDEGLASRSNWGDLIGLAVSSYGIPVITAGGKQLLANHTTASAALAASALVELANEDPSLEGETLINRLLTKRTTRLSKLSGEIRNPLGLVDR